MSAANPRYIKSGLDVSEAFLLATRFAIENALADSVLREKITYDEVMVILKQVKEEVATLMRDGEVVIAPGTVAALTKGNRAIEMFSDALTEDADELIRDIEKELANV